MGCNPNARAERLEWPKITRITNYSLEQIGRAAPLAYLPIVVHILAFSLIRCHGKWKEKGMNDNWLINVLAKRFHLAELWRVVVIKGIGGDSVVELLDVVRTFRAEVVDLVVVLKNDPYEPFAAIWCIYIYMWRIAVVDIFWPATGKRDQIIKGRTKKEEVADTVNFRMAISTMMKEARHLVFLLEQVADVFQLVPVHWLQVLGGVAHRDHPVRDVGEVKVVPALNEPALLLRHKCLDRVGHSHPPRLTLLHTIKIRIRTNVETVTKWHNMRWFRDVFVVDDFRYLVSVGPSHIDHPPGFSLTITRS